MGWEPAVREVEKPLRGHGPKRMDVCVRGRAGVRVRKRVCVCASVCACQHAQRRRLEGKRRLEVREAALERQPL